MVKAASKPKVPSVGEATTWEDSRGVGYTVGGMPYLTTNELAIELSMHPETVFRWCRKWFGDLPKGRTGAKQGYRIPLEYRMVARAWLQTEDVALREVIRRAIVAEPRNWVVVVANVGTTHYSVSEALGRVESITRHSPYGNQIVSLMYVGDPTERQ